MRWRRERGGEEREEERSWDGRRIRRVRTCRGKWRRREGGGGGGEGRGWMKERLGRGRGWMRERGGGMGGEGGGIEEDEEGGGGRKTFTAQPY